MNGCLGLPHMGNDQPGQEQHGSTGQGPPGHCTHVSALQRSGRSFSPLKTLGVSLAFIQ